MQANPSLDRSDDNDDIIDLKDGLYLIRAVARKYRFLTNYTLEQQPRKGGASDDIVVRLQVFYPSVDTLEVANPAYVDVLVELRSAALAEAVEQQGEQLLNYSVGRPASDLRSSPLGACRTRLLATRVRHAKYARPPHLYPAPKRKGKNRKEQLRAVVV